MPELLDFPDEPLPDLSLGLPVPSWAQIGWMKRNVQALGGRLISGVCRPRGIAYPAEDGVRTVMVNTCGCGNETIADVPFEGDNGAPATICLVCDGAIEWPRLEGEEATGGPPAEPPPFSGSGGAGWV